MNDRYALVPSAPTGAHEAEVLQLVLDPEPWMQGALCAETDPEAFFPPKGGSTEAAKRICAGCDVRLQCLEYALRRGEQHGIWGGKSPLELRRMRKKKGMAA